jgi:hypothetical protein
MRSRNKSLREAIIPADFLRGTALATATCHLVTLSKQPSVFLNHVAE